MDPEVNIEATGDDGVKLVTPSEPGTSTDTPSDTTPDATGQAPVAKPVESPEDREKRTEARFDRRWKERERKLRSEMTAEFEAKYGQLTQAQKNNPETQQEIAEWYRELFGDTPEVRNVYGKFNNFLSERDKKLKESIVAEFQSKQQEEQQAVDQWQEVIDERLGDLEDTKGVIFLGESEEAKRNRQELLAIVHDYTPKDAKGNYLSDFISFDKAYEILELKRANQKSPTQTRQRNAAARTSSDVQSGTVAPKREPGTIGSFFNRDVSEYYNK